MDEVACAVTMMDEVSLLWMALGAISITLSCILQLLANGRKAIDLRTDEESRALSLGLILDEEEAREFWNAGNVST